MSVNAFIPQVWSARILEALRKALVFGQPGVINHDYEGVIAQAGDTVRITGIGDITVFDYVKNTDMPGPEQLSASQTTLVVDQAKAFHFGVDDIDRRQGLPGFVSAAMRQAAFRLRDTADRYVAGLYAQAGNAVGTAGAPKTDLGTATNAYNHLVALGVALDEADVPQDGRFVVIPPWYEGQLLLDDRFVKSGVEGGEQRLLNGLVKRAAGFDILKSNNTSNDATTWRIMAGVDMAITFAQQINQVEGYRPERRFGDAVKGLHLYGAKVVRPEALAVLYANRP